ncbi:transcription factor E [Nanobdella aerobiophila]|uniref:Transcription factor E n=1 Tax=Nanobdella aerobiophila TaxID=2586965 RepID=A0A915WRW0_9ARCH|nr:hypothetical protein [Nanobdella aerobiophila]BBL45669.1 transcription factor E [Nanobdella aerobiophila]
MTYLLNEDFRKVLEYISDKKEFTEKEVRRELKIREDEIRKLLYILEENGVIYPLNIINNNGKFDFRWGNRVPNKKEFFNLIFNKELDKIKKEIEDTPKTIYYCENCNLGYTFEESYENDFKCRECGTILKEKENFRIIELENIENNILLLKKNYIPEKRVSKARGKR